MPEYRDLSEEQLEGALRSLPRRDPPAALRDRVLAAAAPRPALRFSYALALLVLLVLADLAVMKRQDSLLPSRPPAPAVLRAARDPELVALLADTYSASGRWRRALETQSSDDSYWTLRNRELGFLGKG